MANELVKFAEWTFFQECPIPSDVSEMMTQGEQPVAAFKTIRDVATFTNKRMIVRDAQGLTGKKVETYSLPWSSVDMWSMENAGTLDFNAEIELWTRAGHVKINLKKGADIRKIEWYIAQYVMQ